MPPEEPRRSNGGSAAVAGAAVGSAGVAAGSVAPASAGLVVGPLAIREVTAAALAGLRTFWGDGSDDVLWLGTTLRRRHPELTQDEIRDLLRQEADYGATFRRRMEARLERDVPKALTSAEPKEALRKLLEREKRYISQRQEAMLSRSISAIERDGLKRTSPAGAYWRLSPYVKEHTIDCIVMAGKFWPWEVLDVIHPPRHAGCPCELRGLEEAKAQGLLPPAFVPPHPEEGIALARELQERFAELREAAASPEEVRRLVEAMESRRLLEAYAPRRFAKGTVKGGQFMPKVGGFASLVKKDFARALDSALATNSRGSTRVPQRAPSAPEHGPEKPGARGPMPRVRTDGPRRPGAPPKDFEEFANRAMDGAAKLAGEHKASLVFKGIQVNPEEPDHTALRYWDGSAEIGKDAGPSLAVARAAQMGESDEKAASDAYLTYSRTAHEASHGINPITPAEMKTPEGYALEEALAEEVGGRDVALRWLNEDGHTDALDWVGANPDHPRVLGAYATERARLGVVLDEAEVPEEARAGLLRTMAFRQTTQARVNTLSALLSNATGLKPALAEAKVRETMGGARDAELGIDVDPEGHIPLLSTVTEFRTEGGRQNGPEEPLAGAQGASPASGEGKGAAVPLKPVSGAQGFDARHYSDPRRSLLRKMKALGKQGDKLELADGTVIQKGPSGSFRVTPPDTEGKGRLYSTPMRAIDTELNAILKRHGLPGRADQEKSSFAGDSSSAQVPPAGPEEGQKAPAAPPHAQAGIPAYDESKLQLHDFKAAGGSNGAQFATDAAGRKWLVKTYRGNTDRVATELLANAVYRELGVRVPEAGRLHGELDFSSIPDEPFDEPPLPELPKVPVMPEPQTPFPRVKLPWNKGPKPMMRKEQSTGMLVLEPDGRVWVFEPKNHFGGYEHTFSKGRLEEGLTPQQNARKELWEELGIRANPVGYLGDFEGDVTMTRMFVARRTSDPVEPPGGETEPDGVKLVPAEEALKMLNRPRDREILEQALEREWPEAGEDRLPEENPVPKLAYPLVDGETQRWKGESQELGEGFMADALVGNWDVVGLEQDNVLWDEEGSPIRVDQGGTFEFRAMGKTKPFGPVPTEVWTMRGPKGQANGRMMLTDEMLKDQAADIAERLTPERVDALIAQTPFADEEMRSRVRQNLKARVAFMKAIADGEEELPGPLEGGAAEATLRTDARKLEPYTPEEEAAFVDFEGDLGDRIQSALREKVKVPELADSIKHLDTMLDAARVSEDFNAYMPVSIEAMGVPDAAELAGKRFRENGYMEASTDREYAGRAGKALVRVLVPAGTRALGTAAAGLSTEPGAVVFARGTQIRIAGAHEENGTVVINAVAG